MSEATETLLAGAQQLDAVREVLTAMATEAPPVDPAAQHEAHLALLRCVATLAYVSGVLTGIARADVADA